MNFRKLVFSIFLLCTFTSISYSQIPTFELKLTNRNYLSSNLGFFDVVLKHTNFPQTDFRYSRGRFVIILDQSFLPDHLNYFYSLDTSTYGIERILPQNAGNLYRAGDTLILDKGFIYPAGTEPNISHTAGTLVARIKFFNPDLYQNSCLFEEQFIWKKNDTGFTTEIYANISGSIVRLQNSLNVFSTRDICEDQFCCLNVPLTPPLRKYPLNNSVNNIFPFRFEWQKGYPVSYNAVIQIATDSLFKDIVIDEELERPDGIEPVVFSSHDLEFDTEYYWRVRQGGIPPLGAFNEFWKFRTGVPSMSVNLKVIPDGLLNETVFHPYKIKVYLRNSESPYEITDSTSSFLKNNYFQTDLYFMNAVQGNYYLVLDDQKYIETWSKDGGSYFYTHKFNKYDFTKSASQAYGNNQILLGERYCIYSGDLNSDGVVDLYDLSLVDNNVHKFIKGESETDLNNDFITDIEDYAIADRNALLIVNQISPE